MAETIGASTPQISVTAGTDRLTQREQIDTVRARCQAKKEPIRVRLPVQLYDQTEQRGYLFLRDATWNLQFPSDTTPPEAIEHFIEALGKCIYAIAEHGSEEVVRRLELQLVETAEASDDTARDGVDH